MLRRLKKFTVCSSAIVASQALDDAPFAGQDEAEDLLRRLSECEDASHVHIFDQCIDPNKAKLRVPPRPRRPARRATAPRRRRNLYDNKIGGPIPPEIGQLTGLKLLRVPPRPRRPAHRATVPRRRRELGSNEIGGPIPPEIGQLTALKELRVPAASPTPGAPRDRPRHRRYLDNNKIEGPLPTEIGQLTGLTQLRVPPASPTPGAPRDRPSASQVALL